MKRSKVQPKSHGAEAAAGEKVQLKIQMDAQIHGKLRALCQSHRRTPAGQIEFMTLSAFQNDLGAGPGLRLGKEGKQAEGPESRRPTKET